MSHLPAIRIAILAAGSSTRLGHPKQLLKIRGESLIRRTARTALATHLPVSIVLGSTAETIQNELQGLPVAILLNSEWQEGLASSVRCAVGYAAGAADALLIMTVDQPLVTEALLKRLVDTFLAGAVSLVACRYAGTVGVPALYSRALFPELAALHGDIGAKSVIERHRTDAALIDFPEGAVDIDTPEGFKTLRQESM